MTDEVIYKVIAEKETYPLTAIALTCGGKFNQAGVVIFDGEFRADTTVYYTVEVRFDKTKVVKMEGVVGKDVGRIVLIRKSKDLRIFANGLRKNAQVAIRIEGGETLVIPLTGAKAAMAELDKHCPHFTVLVRSGKRKEIYQYVIEPCWKVLDEEVKRDPKKPLGTRQQASRERVQEAMIDLIGLDVIGKNNSLAERKRVYRHEVAACIDSVRN